MFVRPLLVTILAFQLSTPTYSSEPAYGLDTRPAWSNDRFSGFPDPLPPYRVVRAYPKLERKGLLCVGTFPDSPWMWLITHRDGYAGPGTIAGFRDDSQTPDTETLLEIPEIIYGLAFHPQFKSNGYVFLGCNGKSEALDKVATKVYRVTIDRQPPFKFDQQSLKLIIEWPSDGHNGGDLAFGNDGLLYVTAGDGTSDSDANLTGQDLSTINGSVIRINVDKPDGDKPYGVPRDNPFVGIPEARPEIWAFGLRNPWRMTYDSKSDQLWVGNNGQDLWETAHLIRKGENYGWSVNEGSHPFQPARKQGPAPLTPPTVEHPHSEARSLTGGIVYRGSREPQLVGAYIYGDYSTGNIWAVKHDGERVLWHKHLARSTLQISGFGIDTHGEVLVVDHEGGLYHLEKQPPQNQAVKFPTRLSETGLYADVARGTMNAGLIPYSVMSPLWSDGAGKSRWLAVPTAGQIEGTDVWGWNFPSGSLLVKTFTLPMVRNQSVVDQRVETRIMAKVDKEWFGYSYRWNEDQTDATLVAAAGDGHTYRVSHSRSASQAVDQAWRFPSRTECMVCHSRAANYVLGLSTVQMNHEHDYGEVSDNQLRTLARIGLLKMPGQTSTAGQLPKQVSEYPHLVDPLNESESLELRVKSYLHSNCAHCHTEAGGGNSKMELSFHTPLDKMRVLEATAQHDTFRLEGARLIAKGEPDHSLIPWRMARRGPGQMPPLASVLVDEQAVELFRKWIAAP